MQADSPSRTQEERSRTTRRRLMEATVDCLVEYGWSKTTTTLVAERAGVSRGAQLHHFRTRGELVAAAVDHLSQAGVAEMRREISELPHGHERTEAVLAMMARFYVSPVFTAALELWVAARTDEQLHSVVVPLEQRLGREAHRLTVELLGADESKPGVREAVQATLDLTRGLGLANLLTDDSARRRSILRGWAHSLDRTLAEAHR